MNFLASPPLVVAYALAGTIDIDINTEPLGTDQRRQPVFLKDIWPSARRRVRRRDAARRSLGDVQEELCERVQRRRALARDRGAEGRDRIEWEATSTYVRNPPYFDGMTHDSRPQSRDIRGARALAVLGDSVTTDHISPAGNIAKDSPAAKYLMEHGVQPADFNQYGARRGNHEVMMRGTFANIRLRNLLLPGTEGGVTRAHARAASRCRSTTRR